MSKRSDHARGLTLAITGVLVLSPDTLLIRLIDADAWTILFWRGSLMALTLGAYYALRYRHKAFARFRAIGRTGLLAGALFAANSMLFVTSVTLTKVANTLVIISAAPLFAAVLSFLFLAERPPWRTWLAVVAGLVGIAVIFSGSIGGGALLGDLCALGTAWFFAAHLTLVRRVRHTNMVPTLVVNGLIVATVAALAAPAGVSAVPADDVVWLFLLGVIVLPVSFNLIVRAPRYLPAPEVSLIMLLEAVLGPLWVWLALAEEPPAATFVGGALVLGTLIAHELAGLTAARTGTT